MKTITISDETAKFLTELTTRLKTQDRRCTADPFYFTIQKTVEVAVPEGCGEDVRYFDREQVESYSAAELKERATEQGCSFEDLEDCCQQYDIKEDQRYEGFFFTLEGYNEHIRLNGHNVARTCKRYESYVEHGFRNPELEGVMKALREIGEAIISER